MDRLQRSAPPFAPTTTGDREIADALGPMLPARGLPLVELDAIGGCLTQVNVKPTPQACSERRTRAESCSCAVLDRWPRPRHVPCAMRRARRGLLQRRGAV